MRHLKKSIICFVMLATVFSFSVVGYAESLKDAILADLQKNVMSMTEGADTEPVISVDSVTVEKGESATIPIRISGNTGICGSTISVKYDKGLILTKVEKGDALNSLTFTEPGDLSANPVNLVWDGLEADSSDGIIARLTFTAPEKTGKYNISAFYEDGDIVDGNLQPIVLETKPGGVEVTEESTETPPADSPVISAGKAEVNPGESVTIPVILSGNTGICGAAISVQYGKGLTLTGVKAGEAFSSLVFTKPGDLSANPVNLVWDGMEADRTDGVIAELTFTVPEKSGDYSIRLSYEEGDVVDGDLKSVELQMEDGMVHVIEAMRKLSGSIEDQTVELEGEMKENTRIVTAFYEQNGKMQKAVVTEVKDNQIRVEKNEGACFAKVLWLDEKSRPLCEAKTIRFD